MAILQGVIIAGAAWCLWRLFRSYILYSPLDNVPGPSRSSFLLGNLPEFFSRNGWDFQDALGKRFGPVVKFHGMLGKRMLYVYDPTALHSIFVKDQHAYEEPSWFFASNMMIFGPGLLATQGEVHRRQKKMLNPAFSSTHLRNLMPIFYQVVHKLRTAMEAEVQDSCKEMDMLSWLNRTALELIGQSALGYSFDPLVSESRNVFGDALKALLPALSKLSVLRMLVQYFDKLGPRQLRRRLAEMIPNADFQQLKRVIDTMDQKSRDIYSEKKAGLGKDNEAGLQQQLEEDKDILSILLRANLEAADEDRLPEDELIGQISTLVFAATDTTSSAISRVLHLLAQHQDVQEQLRKEIVEARHGQDISYDQLLELPLLDAVCRETLRLYPPVTTSFCDTVQDVVLPLGEPIQGARDGTLLHEIAVPKHTSIVVGIRGSNRHKAVWGEDAEEWKPVERWLAATHPPSSGSASTIAGGAPRRVPGVYSNLMTFSAGSRSCIGFKLAEIEMKVVLSVLLETFKFSISGTERDVVWNMAFVVYPSTVGKDSSSSCGTDAQGTGTPHARLPLRVERCHEQ